MLKFNPNFLASIAALAIFCPPSFANSANISVLSAISFNTCAGATPSALANSPTDEIKFIFVSIEAPLIASIDLSNFAALAPLIPNCPVIKPKSLATPAETTEREPNSSTKPLIAFSASCELPPTNLADIPAIDILPANLADSTADVPNDCLTSNILLANLAATANNPANVNVFFKSIIPRVSFTWSIISANFFSFPICFNISSDLFNSFTKSDAKLCISPKCSVAIL